MISFHQKFSSPLKIILSGEHSVVYGKNAIASAINLRYYSEIQEIQSENSKFFFLFNDKLIDSFETNSFLETIYKIQKFGHTEIKDYKIFQEKIENNKEFLSNCKDKSFFYVFYTLFIEYFVDKSEKDFHKHYEKKSVFLRISTKVPDLTGIGSSASYLSCISACLIVIYGLFLEFIKRSYF